MAPKDGNSQKGATNASTSPKNEKDFNKSFSNIEEYLSKLLKMTADLTNDKKKLINIIPSIEGTSQLEEIKSNKKSIEQSIAAPENIDLNNSGQPSGADNKTFQRKYNIKFEIMRDKKKKRFSRNDKTDKSSNSSPSKKKITFHPGRATEKSTINNKNNDSTQIDEYSPPIMELVQEN